jgi:hypothetical protein
MHRARCGNDQLYFSRVGRRGYGYTDTPPLPSPRQGEGDNPKMSLGAFGLHPGGL